MSRGYTILVNYRSNKEKAETVKAEIEVNGVRAELLPFDVASPQAIETAIDAWEQGHPDEHISVLVNNAGIRRDGMMFTMADNDWHSVFYITGEVIKISGGIYT